jgi:hypothetical protein
MEAKMLDSIDTKKAIKKWEKAKKKYLLEHVQYIEASLALKYSGIGMTAYDGLVLGASKLFEDFTCALYAGAESAANLAYSEMLAKSTTQHQTATMPNNYRAAFAYNEVLNAARSDKREN